MDEWGVFWLRVALVLYSLGLWHSLRTVIEQRQQMFLAALTSISVGAFFHFVSLAAEGIAIGGFPVRSLYQMASLSAFLITVLFLWVYWRYKYESLAVFVFPIVFVLSLTASLGKPLEPWIVESTGGWWLAWLHVALFLLGYAALFLTFIAGVMYLIQERELKSKKPRAFYYRLPPLNKLDEVAHRMLSFGFVSVTLGLIVASVYAASRWGVNWIVDPTIALAFLTWLIYLAMVFGRVAVGWRGRKSAYFSIAGFSSAALTWIVNSGVHSFMRP
jgi:ABC-type uncharacterized transport system permease subunit